MLKDTKAAFHPRGKVQKSKPDLAYFPNPGYVGEVVIVPLQAWQKSWKVTQIMTQLPKQQQQH